MGFQLATWWEPYLFIPSRYTSLVAPVLVMVLLPASLLSIFSQVRWLKARPDLVKAISVASCVGIVFFAAGRMAQTGFNVRIPDEGVAFYSFIETLPNDALIAGLPKGVIEHVPYLSEKSVLYSYETHMVFHEEYALVMRERLSRILDALYSTSQAPLLSLRDEHEVTHLVVEKDRYSGFTYFPPFDAMVERLAGQVVDEPGFLVDMENAIVFEQDELMVIDLSQLEPVSPPRSMEEMTSDPPF